VGPDLLVTALAALTAAAGTWVGHATTAGPRPQLLAFLAAGTTVTAGWALVGLWYWRRLLARRAAHLDDGEDQKAAAPTGAPT